MTQPSAIAPAALLLGRIMLAAIFVISGYGKIGGFAGTQQYMASAGVPGFLLPLVIALELAGGLLLVAGWQTRIIAFLLAGFTLLAGLLFHFDLANQGQVIHLLKNIAISGGLLALVASGAGAWSVDGRRD